VPNDSIFEDDELQADALSPEAEAPPVEKAPERGPDGKFVAKEPSEETPAASDESDEGKPPAGTVPQGALHAERERRKAVEADLASAKAQLEAIAKLREQVAGRQPAALPDANDPAAVEHLRTRLAEIEQGQTRVTQRIDAQQLDDAEAQQLGAVMTTSETAFREKQPDYDPAIQHLVNARAEELALYGYQPAQIQQVIADEAREIVKAAVQRGQDPAEMGYKIAVSRGYRPSGATASKRRRQRHARGHRTSKGRIQVARRGGGSSAAQINAEAIAQMSDDEFSGSIPRPKARRWSIGSNC
jgi:hypothetical protein